MRVHGITEGSPTSAMIGVRAALGDAYAETICDALQCLALHPECWSWDDEMSSIHVLLHACDQAGINATREEFDFLHNPFLRFLVRRYAKLLVDRPPYFRGRITYMNECVDVAEAKDGAVRIGPWFGPGCGGSE